MSKSDTGLYLFASSNRNLKPTLPRRFRSSPALPSSIRDCLATSRAHPSFRFLSGTIRRFRTGRVAAFQLRPARTLSRSDPSTTCCGHSVATSPAWASAADLLSRAALILRGGGYRHVTQSFVDGAETGFESSAFFCELTLKPYKLTEINVPHW